MSFFAYMLRCSDGSYYVGHSEELEARFAAHQSGQVPGYTQNRRPVQLVWAQEFTSREEALAAERQVKGWSRAKKEALIQGDWKAISALASRAKILRDAASAGSPAPQDERVVDGNLNAPIIVLVRPQLGQNIGKAARAMLNFGITELRLVSPRDGWPNPDAGPAASGADAVLEGAEVFETTAEAIADCSLVFASTVRRRDLVVPVVGPDEMAREIHDTGGRTAILFGPERSGLETEDVAVANRIVTVPINPEFGSLNLAQAVILLAYEWSKGTSLVQPTARETEPAAPMSNLEGLIGQLEEELETVGYFFPPDRIQATKTTLRTILTKPQWSSREISALRGVIRALVTHRSSKSG
ncbi:GIY-YIG nuclease family protein [Sphingomonas sp. NSE70-1]|uniref:GIY-YIG nuclease family protein n=1 Tax=Sphingomonas caseinilyticus TaxID=2908205 RepID=A0ABT0RSE5_9SPHN|nr:TrmH family RNA methyltransferase [Sphingomonas caseinilyticus]MCL6697844.1 GIY-YIG nuclease family protein [Sphingomonas caseinilyticus]